MKLLGSMMMALGIAVVSTAADAQAKWPERPITFVVPYAAGGYTDLVGRITARYVEKHLGQPVVIENRPGAGGIVGAQYVSRSKPDGYTFCVCGMGAISIAPFVQTTGYVPMKDLIPISIVSSIVQAVIVKNDMPIKSMPDLVAYAKANPGKLNYGSSGAGGLTHYSVELFQARTGTKMTHIPFKGGAPATAAVIGGQVDLSFANMTDALPQIRAGTVRGLAVTSLERSPDLPDLPTVHEVVLPDFVVDSWNGIMAPTNTPEPIIDRMAEILMQMAEDPQVKEILRKAGSITIKTTPAEYQSVIEKEMTQWGPLIKEIAATK